MTVVMNTVLVVCVHCYSAAAAQVNSSAVHRVYSSAAARPLISVSTVGRHHRVTVPHRRDSAASVAGDGSSNIPSSSVTTETMVDRSRTSSNSSSESSRHHLYDNQLTPAQVTTPVVLTDVLCHWRCYVFMLYVCLCIYASVLASSEMLFSCFLR